MKRHISICLTRRLAYKCECVSFVEVSSYGEERWEVFFSNFNGNFVYSVMTWMGQESLLLYLLDLTFFLHFYTIDIEIIHSNIVQFCRLKFFEISIVGLNRPDILSLTALLAQLAY